jgi:hypothetical protein
MRRGITIPRVILGLALLTAASRRDFAPLVDLIAFPIALSLFAIAPLSILGVLLSPFAWRSVFGSTYAIAVGTRCLPRWRS